MTLYFGKRHK